MVSPRQFLAISGVAIVSLMQVPPILCAGLPERSGDGGIVADVSSSHDYKSDENTYESVSTEVTIVNPSSSPSSLGTKTGGLRCSPTGSSTTAPTTKTPGTAPSIRPEATSSEPSTGSASFSSVLTIQKVSELPTIDAPTDTVDISPSLDTRPTSIPSSTFDGNLVPTKNYTLQFYSEPQIGSTVIPSSTFDDISVPNEGNALQQSEPQIATKIATKIQVWSLVIMLASLVMVSSAMVVLGIRYQKTNSRRSWEESTAASSPLM